MAAYPARKVTFDLHAHSTASDGLLTPAALVARAAAHGVDVLALTDHDDTAGIAEAASAARAASITLVPGVEVSATWERHTVHVVGLHVDGADPALAAGLAQVRAGRQARARRIAEALAQVGIRGAYEGAMAFAGGDHLVSRAHFARYLVAQGRAKSAVDVFRRYLVPGKPGYVAHDWAPLAEAITWIRAAGGQAVLAHPGRYAVTPTGMRRLLASFRDAGGDALEVVSGAHTRAECETFAGYARSFGLLASTGSDFHGPEESPHELGSLPAALPGTTPVWSRW
ncbi:MAG: PHP domain-containing protein [Burkholderiales bacterium]|nr:PHP domain-containing protein [Burkholderiales bacterium]